MAAESNKPSPPPLEYASPRTREPSPPSEDGPAAWTSFQAGCASLALCFLGAFFATVGLLDVVAIAILGLAGVIAVAAILFGVQAYRERQIPWLAVIGIVMGLFGIVAFVFVLANVRF